MPRLDHDEAWRRLAAARVAYLATVRADGRPHVVPIVFAVKDGVVHSIADPKPKDGLDLLRHRNIRANAAVSVLADAYDEAWERLWWVRADGTARILPAGHAEAIELLRERYPQYAERPPEGPVVAIDVNRWSEWSAAARPPADRGES
jgi:PPOX class probable F420-dependent enzyme